MANKCCDSDNLKIEVVKCSTCGNTITDSLVIRCPRCFSSLITKGCSGGCRSCGQKADCC